MTKRHLHLLIIDPQNDFCDLPEAYCPELPDGSRLTPALPVPGAHADFHWRAQTAFGIGTNLPTTLRSHPSTW